jgi:hypothetical protein
VQSWGLVHYGPFNFWWVNETLKVWVSDISFCKLRKEGRTGKKEGCLRAFFLIIFFTKYWGKKISNNTICLQKKVKKRNCKPLLPLNLKKCIMVKTWGIYASMI